MVLGESLPLIVVVAMAKLTPPIQKWRKKVKTWLFFGRNAVTVDEGMNLKRGGGVLLGVRFWSDVP